MPSARETSPSAGTTTITAAKSPSSGNVARPATFSLLFHTAFPLSAREAGEHHGQGETAALTIRSLGSEQIVTTSGLQPMCHTGGDVTHELDLLTVKNAEPTKRAVFVTLLRTADAGSDIALKGAGCDMGEQTVTVRLPDAEGRGPFEVDLNGGITARA